jgi:hypothetical protein
LISHRAAWFFGDSSFQICIREADQDALFAYDEHGIFFFYEHESASRVLAQMGYEDRPAPLVSSAGHWEFRPEGAEEHLGEFKKALKLKSVFHSDEAEQ